MPLETLVDKTSFLAEALAGRIEAAGRHAVATRGHFSLALTGGSFATSFFPRLATLPLDWSRTHFFWGDERAVPPDHPDSNYAVARSLWLDPAGVPPGVVHRMAGEAEDLHRAAREYESALEGVAGRPPRLDVTLLGVGPDGHVCSLFPGHKLLKEKERRVAVVEDSPKPPPRRLTLTLPAVAESRLVIAAVLGRAKAEVARSVLEDPGSELPLALAIRQAPEALVLMDPEAASLLRGR